MFTSFVFVLALLPVSAFGDPIDWISPEYVLLQGKSNRRPGAGSPDLSAARAAIVQVASRLGRVGPWSVVSKQQARAPSGDLHDYLSWAPYHWPSCNWCASGKNHIVHTISGSENDTATATAVYPSSNIDPTPTNIHGGDDPYQYFVSAPSAQPTTPPESSDIDFRTRAPRAVAKTTKAACSPSPTTSLAPSATWTSCPYVIRDGQVNPDVRSLPGPETLISMAQAILYNTFGCILANDNTYCKRAVLFLETFFIDPTTKMNPNVDYGQIVRGVGPAGREGTFTGILDNRNLVKVVNAVSLLREIKALDWTSDLDDSMRVWMQKYVDWLVKSDIGKKTASRPNNHCPFYKVQVASALILIGDIDGARATILGFFQDQFQDQIAVTGEQPFEAVRTRPLHYRLFNLEALMALAKLGDEVGIDCWSMRSKYGATIKTAFDYAMKLDPKGEDKSQIYPLVPAIIAAYGDVQGKYEAFLKKNHPKYQSEPTWFGNQRGALSHAPSSSSNVARAIVWQREDGPITYHKLAASSVPSVSCPRVFDGLEEVELDNGVYVSCDDIMRFYGNTPALEPPVLNV